MRMNYELLPSIAGARLCRTCNLSARGTHRSALGFTVLQSLPSRGKARLFAVLPLKDAVRDVPQLRLE